MYFSLDFKVDSKLADLTDKARDPDFWISNQNDYVIDFSLNLICLK